ncbi:uncharacterized protein LOC143580386 [Bidens hawaiensis]|uniref:uncharacterized protein LOC143550016 n=1 Tax=Bidens hawaiensis TaxID=980011 RepID=UPI004049C7DA
MDIMSGVPSMLLTLVNDEELTVHIPGMEKLETDDGPCVILQMPGLPVPKGEYQAVAHNTVVEDDTMLMSYKTSKETYLAAVKLPENVDPVGRMNGLISKGMVKLTFPYLKNTDFVHTPVKIVRPTPYCDAFDRSDLGRKLCEVIAHSVVKSKSFTAYKKDTGESIYIKGNLPGVEKNVVNKEGLCVSLNMPGFEIEDVESGFEYDTLIIEGKRENKHYIAGIRVPEGFKREMQDGLYKVTLPHVDVNRLAFRTYR